MNNNESMLVSFIYFVCYLFLKNCLTDGESVTTTKMLISFLSVDNADLR